MNVTTSENKVLIYVAIILTIIQSTQSDTNIILVKITQPEPQEFQNHIINSITFNKYNSENDDHRRYVLYILNNAYGGIEFWRNEFDNNSYMQKILPFFQNEDSYSNDQKVISFLQYRKGVLVMNFAKHIYSNDHLMYLLTLLPNANDDGTCKDYMHAKYNELKNATQKLRDANIIKNEHYGDVEQRLVNISNDETDWCKELSNNKPLPQEPNSSYALRCLKQGIVPVYHDDFQNVFGHDNSVKDFDYTTMKDIMSNTHFIMAIIINCYKDPQS